MAKCGRCNGSGTVVETLPDGTQKQSTCPSCGGSGRQ